MVFGIVRLAAQNFKEFKKGPEDGKHISSDGIFSLCAVDSGVWIGAFESGVNFYNYKTKSIRHCFRDNDSGIPCRTFHPELYLRIQNLIYGWEHS
jgi:hypothetical protein